MQIHGYQLVRTLGRGSFGEVYLALREMDGEQVAVKVLLDPGEENLRRFAREARVLHQQIANPYVVRLLDARLDTSPPFIVMEYCPGGSLRNAVGASPPWSQVVFALSQAASGLDGIHDLGGFHRDVKPENLLMGRDSQGRPVVKVGDFGLARIPSPGSSRPMTRSAWGTDGYMAPELQYDEPFVAACDVYSLGVTGIELLTGSRNPAQLRTRPDAPAKLCDLLLQMASPDPTYRPTMKDVIKELAQLGLPNNKPPTPEGPARRPTPPSPPAQGSGLGWLAGLGGLAVVVGGIALLTMNNRDDDGRWRDNNGRFRKGPWG